MTHKRDPQSPPLPRRDALKALVGIGLTSGLCGCARALTPGQIPADQAAPSSEDPEVSQDSPMTAAPSVEEHEHPADGDLLVFSFGGREGQVIEPGDIGPEDAPIFAYPMDADSRHIASESRLNEVILVRLDSAELSEETAGRSALGIVAYSAVCTHTGCEVSDWEEDTKRLKCPCHESEFDPSDNGRVVDGPAPLRLAALPLRVADGVLSVAGGFNGPLGAQDP